MRLRAAARVGGGGGAAGGGAATGGGGVASAGDEGANGPGITDTTISIGLAYAVNAAAANAAIGAAGISQGDARRVDEIVLADINANGGAGGRQLVPVWHELDATSPASTDQLYQEACDTWTQDNEVFAGFLGGNENAQQCLHDRGVLAITSNLTVADAATFERFPYYVEVSSINLDRIAATQVAASAAQGYFTGWDSRTQKTNGNAPKVGILTFDMPTFAHAADEVMVPALAQLGYAPDPANVVKVPRNAGTSDTAAVAAAVSNAVLRFRGNGVTHVFILEASAVLALLFLNQADAERYFPRYGVNTQNGIEVLIDTGNVPARQAIGAVGFGWYPMIDIAPSQNPTDGPYSNARRQECIGLLAANGMSFADTNAEAVALNECESLWFFRDTVNRMGPVINRDNFMAAVDQLGASFAPVGTFAAAFGPGRHDGVAAVRYWAFDAGCGCMTYTSGDIPV